MASSQGWEAAGGGSNPRTAPGLQEGCAQGAFQKKRKYFLLVLFLRSTWIKLNREVIVIILLTRKIQDDCGTGEIHYLDHITIWSNWIIILINIIFNNKVWDDMFLSPYFQ
jgi:hypothetical protein